METERLLDTVGWSLLRELQANARLSYAELGRRVGLTPPAVAERIRRMEEAGIIVGYRLGLNMERLGLSIRAIVRLETGDGQGSRFAAAVREYPEVLECHHVTGVECYVLHVAVSSVRHLEQFLERLSAYGATTTSIVLSSPVTHRIIDPPGAPDRNAPAPAMSG